MSAKKRLLVSTAAIPLMFVGVAAVSLSAGSGVGVAPAHAACSPCNPCAAAKCGACNPCNPCAAAKCGACNPCNPCAAAKCGACNPCNPCASAKCGACNPCNPCAAAKCGACNPCNPCAAACNPCNPCAAAAGGKSACVVPRLAKAAKCNPCAAAKCGACNPCNPCAAACNPCNPCGGCNPCAAGGNAELTGAEAAKVYECLLEDMKKAYAKSDNDVAVSFASYQRYSKVPYVSATHGGRYVQNYGNTVGRAYGAFENAGELPAGTKLAKPSFTVNAKGHASVGPLFIMVKKAEGWNPSSGDWEYSMVMPNGNVVGTTKGKGASNVQFCVGCHMAVTPEQDSIMLLPKKYRVK